MNRWVVGAGTHVPAPTVQRIGHMQARRTHAVNPDGTTYCGRTITYARHGNHAEVTCQRCQHALGPSTRLVPQTPFTGASMVFTCVSTAAAPYDTITAKVTPTETILRFEGRNGETGPTIHVTKHGARLWYPGGSSEAGSSIEALLPKALAYEG